MAESYGLARSTPNSTEPVKPTLFDLYAEHIGKVSDKWAIYLKIYDRLFSPYRAAKLRLLEIGIQNGGSLEIWSQYFEAAEVLVGCDINPECAQLCYDDPRLRVVVADANTNEAESNITKHAGRFDIIIDDGSHRSSDIIRSFARYFPLLEQGGLFVVEDLHCSYWEEFEGGLVDPWSSISFLKRLADVVNHEHWGLTYERAEILRSFEDRYGVALHDADLAQVHSIEFFNSVCVVRKCSPSQNQLGVRVVAGTDAITDAQMLKALRGAHPTAMGQNANVWSQLPPLPEIELVELRAFRDRMVIEKAQWIASEASLLSAASRLEKRFEQIKHESRSEIELLQQHKRDVLNHAEALEAQLGASRKEVENFRASTSWRITSPMRQLADLLRRIANKH